MTNFQGQRTLSRLHWLTPERALFFVPILTSLGAGVVLLSLALVPIWSMLRERQMVVEELSIKGLELPRIERDLQQKQAMKLHLEDQEDRLIKMLAGTKDLDTFLTALNLLAVKHQVIVAATEPGAIEVWSPSMEPANVKGQDTYLEADNSVASVDSLLQEGLEKRSALITVKGGFGDVQGFLQDLESLEVFVITSELGMEAIRAPIDMSGNEPFIRTKLEIQLSAYGRASQPATPYKDVNYGALQ